MTCTVGVDFGTSTTEVAVYDHGRTQIVSGWSGSPILPSVAAFLPNGTLEIGQGAKTRAGIDPKNSIHSAKRIIGLPWRSDTVQKFRASYGFDLEESPDGSPVFVTRAGKKSAGDIAEIILKHVAGFPVFEAIKADRVAVTVPSAFGPKPRNVIVAAARRAGFDKIEVLDEPYAAVMPYLAAAGGERFLAVYDLGGGTFDFALIKVNGVTHWLLASAGAPYLGGNDIDLRLADWAAETTLITYRQDLHSDPAVRHRLLLAAEEAKIALSDATETDLDLETIDPTLVGKKLKVERAQLERLCQDLVRRTFATCDEVLAKAKVNPSKVTDVVLVGGVTRMPSVREALRGYFGRAPLAEHPPDQVVAIGAAMAAALLSGDREVFKG